MNNVRKPRLTACSFAIKRKVRGANQPQVKTDNAEHLVAGKIDFVDIARDGLVLHQHAKAQTPVFRCQSKQMFEQAGTLKCGEFLHYRRHAAAGGIKFKRSVIHWSLKIHTIVQCDNNIAPEVQSKPEMTNFSHLNHDCGEPHLPPRAALTNLRPRCCATLLRVNLLPSNQGPCMTTNQSQETA